MTRHKVNPARCQICDRPIQHTLEATKLREFGFCANHLPDVYKCHATTRKGTRCKFTVEIGSQYCKQHQNGSTYVPEDDETFWESVFELGRAMYNSRRNHSSISENWKVNYYDYIASPQWRVKAEAAKLRAGYRCQLCNSSSNLNVHHRTYERLGKEEPDDLTVLCNQCHAKFHDKLPGG